MITSVKQYNLLLERVEYKDWSRMSDLILKDKDGANVASKITNLDKAINRYVAGIKLLNKRPDYDIDFNVFEGPFSEFANQALKLGATADDIFNTFDTATVPTDIEAKITNLKSKKLDSSLVGPISSAILKQGIANIDYDKVGGNAITAKGKDAMSQNGRKWTMGVHSKILIRGNFYQLDFDVITDEGGGSSLYVVANSSDTIFINNMTNEYEAIGQRKFIADLLEVIRQKAHNMI